jgi:hypothetical protein
MQYQAVKYNPSLLFYNLLTDFTLIYTNYRRNIKACIVFFLIFAFAK